MSSPNYELNLRDYWRIFKKRKFIIIISAIIFSILGTYYNSRQIPVYQSYTTVKIVELRSVAGMLTDLMTYSPGSIMESQTKIIKGFPILKKVAQRLEIINDQTPEGQMHKAIKSIDSKIATETVGNTNILKITVTSIEPVEAMVLANTVASVYVETNLNEKNKQARSVREFIERQLGNLNERMKEQEEMLEKFAAESKNVKVAEPIQQKLTDLEFQLASHLQKYTEKHPKVIQLQEQVATMQGQIVDISGEDLEYARIQREAEVDRKLYAMLKEKLAQARISEAEAVGDVSVLDPAVMPTTPLNPQGNVGVLLGIIMGIVIGGILAFIMEISDTSIGTVEDVEQVTQLPMLGVVPSVKEELNRDKNLMAKMHQSLLGKQMTQDEEAFVRMMVHHRPTSPITEAFRNIRTNLKISSNNRVFLITSSNPKEGKTAITCNLSLAIAQENQKTLIVSSDLRRPQIASTFGIPREPGLSDILQGAVKPSECIRNITDIMLGEIDVVDALSTSGLRNIWIIPAGAYPPNAAELLASRELSSLLEELKKEFDCIIFDSPPVLPVTDAAVIAPLVDGVILCYEIGRTSKSALLRTKTQLEAVDAKILGLILNHTKPETHPLDPYPYYNYKNRYYREEQNSSKK